MKTEPPTTAQLHWDEAGQPISAEFGDVYFSKLDGLAETRFVFVEHNRLAERFRALPDNAAFTIGETGFGSGLNFLCAWQCWLQHAPPSAQLHFVTVEKYPLLPEDLDRALALWPELAALADQLKAVYPPVDAPGLHRLPVSANVSLTLIFADAVAGFEKLLPISPAGPQVADLDCGLSASSGAARPVDAWFLDGFAPAKNPQMWQPALFQRLAQLSHPGTSFATFTSAGAVRRGLAEVGFAVRKTPGFGNKREMLIGEFVAPTPPAEPPRQRAAASWHLVARSAPRPRRIAVVGAGLAGCHSAYALARRGFEVTLIDRDAVAAGASGNAQGVLYTRLSHQGSALADFNLQAYLFATRFYRAHGFFERSGKGCGLLELAACQQEEIALQAVAERYRHSPELASYLDAQAASDKAGVRLGLGGLWLPQAGWFAPAELCQALIEHARIDVKTATAVGDMISHPNSWELFDEGGASVGAFDAVVIACAQSARQLACCRHLPIKSIRGQITQAEPSPASEHLRTVLCGRGYIAPPVAGLHCLGATYDTRSTDLSLKDDDHRTNLGHIAALSPDLDSLTVAGRAPGRAALRCTTPDYLPVVGPAPDAESMIERFGEFRRNGKAYVDQPGCYYPNLFLNLGHGSKGLTYTPIAAELIACMITGEPTPLAPELLLPIHPGRFLIRDLVRKRR